MSINNRFGIDREKTKKYGKLFHTIDFNIESNYSNLDYTQKSKHASCGTLEIGNREYNLTIHELNRLNETTQAALDTIRKKYKIGLM